MEKLTIMLVCAAGMSTSLLVSKMEKAAAARDIDAEIFAVGANNADAYISDKDIDILLLGPQVRFMKAQFEKKVADKNIPVDIIKTQDYGMMDGEKVLSTALETMENF